MKKILAAVGILSLLTLFGIAPPVLAASTETIDGTVISGTKGAQLPNGLTATLDGVRGNHEFVPEQAAPVATGGRFHFTGLPNDATYVVSVTIDGAIYTAMVPKPNSQGVATAQLTIYGSTTSDAAIKVTNANWVVGTVDLPNQQITMLETIQVDNTGDQTYVGDHRGDPGSDVPGVLPRTLRIPLPDGASGFQTNQGFEGSSLLPVSGGWVDTTPLTPGSHSYAYTYKIAFASGGAELRKAMPYPIGTLRVLVPNAGLELRSDHLKESGTVDVGSRSYVVLEGTNIPANTVVTVDMLGLPSTPVGRIDPTAMRIAGFVVIGLAVISVLFLGLRPRRPIVAPDVVSQRQVLLRQLAHIDDRYAAGLVDASRYQSERAHVKRQLIDLVMGGRATADGSGVA